MAQKMTYNFPYPNLLSVNVDDEVSEDFISALFLFRPNNQQNLMLGL